LGKVTLLINGASFSGKIHTADTCKETIISRVERAPPTG
jgi:hypothetical protein